MAAHGCSLRWAAAQIQTFAVGAAGEGNLDEQAHSAMLVRSRRSNLSDIVQCTGHLATNATTQPAGKRACCKNVRTAGYKFPPRPCWLLGMWHQIRGLAFMAFLATATSVLARSMAWCMCVIHDDGATWDDPQVLTSCVGEQGGSL
jgi:hypothetical protein